MAKSNTTNLGLTVVEKGDFYNYIEQHRENYEKIDKNLGLYDKNFNTVAEMVSDSNLVVGDKIKLWGFYTLGDGAGHPRIKSDTDNGTGIPLSSGGFAVLEGTGKVNAKWFGAKGDGVTDDTGAIQKAILNYNNIFFPAGNYKFNASTTLHKTLPNSGLLITGENGKTTITTNFNGVSFRFTTPFTTGHYGKQRGVIISGITFVNDNAANNDSVAVFVDNGTEFGAKFIIDNCVFYKYRDCGIKSIRAFNSQINDCSFIGTSYRVAPYFPEVIAEAGIRLWGADGTLTEQDHSFSNLCLIQNCIFDYIYMGVDIWGSEINSINLCTFQNSTIGVELKGSKKINGVGVGTEKAGQGVARVNLNNCWFERVWKSYTANVIDITDGTFIVPNADDVKGELLGMTGNHYHGANTTPCDAWKGIKRYQPRSVGEAGTTENNKYFYAQDDSSVHYRFYSDEAYMNPKATFEKGFSSKSPIDASYFSDYPTALIRQDKPTTNHNVSAIETVSKYDPTFSGTGVTGIRSIAEPSADDEHTKIRNLLGSNRKGVTGMYYLETSNEFKDVTGHEARLRAWYSESGATTGTITIENQSLENITNAQKPSTPSVPTGKSVIYFNTDLNKIVVKKSTGWVE